MDESVRYLKALVFLQVQALSGGEGFRKAEVLLAQAGFTAREIGEILGKSAAAVAKTLERSRKGTGRLIDSTSL